MRRSSILTSLFAAAVLAAPLSAQAPVAGMLTFRGDIAANGALRSGSVTGAIGPYSADLAFAGTPLANLQKAIIWCVDWQHFAPARNVADSYYLSALTPGADLSKTRQGGLNSYLRAAWLFERVGSSTRYSAKNVQGTVWEMMDPSAFGPTGNPDGLNTGLNDATNYSENTKYFNVQGDLPGSVTRANLQFDWYVLSDYRVQNSGESRTMNQEFMVAVARVPEPSSFALISFGLVALGGIARRRQAQRRTSHS